MSEIHEKLDGQTWWEMPNLEQVSTQCDISLSYSNEYFSLVLQIFQYYYVLVVYVYSCDGYLKLLTSDLSQK